ncbi:GLIPR1-like protein 1 [Clarias gariepinus]
MAEVLHLSLRLVLLLSSLTLSMTGDPFPDITDQDFIHSCVSAHNHARSNVIPPASFMRYMTWDNGLAVLAKTWGTNCLFQHNSVRDHPGFASVGENLWAGAPPSVFRVTSAIKSWVNEDKDYTYYTRTCKAGKMCGHYTQVVWATTYKVGCAVISCPNGVKQTSFSQTPGAIFVCNYATAGNYPNVYPYEQGESCSKCGGEVCENNLCKNYTRDGDAELRVCGVFCKSVLIIRPVSLVFIFISVYVAQRRCPNIFAYIN